MKSTLQIVVPLFLLLVLALSGTAWYVVSTQERAMEELFREQVSRLLSLAGPCVGSSASGQLLLPPASVGSTAASPGGDGGPALTMGRKGPERVSAQPGGEAAYREATFDPLNNAHLADATEQTWINHFRDDRNVTELSGYRKTTHGEQYYIARPIIVQNSCLRCHGSPATAPPEVPARYGTSHGYGWRPGEIIAVRVAEVPVLPLKAAVGRTRTTLWLLAGGLSLGLAVGLYLLLLLRTRNWMKAAVAIVEEIGEQPSSQPRVLVRADSDLEDLGAALNRMADRVHQSQRRLEEFVAQRNSDLVQLKESLNHEMAQRKSTEVELDQRVRDLDSARSLQSHNSRRLHEVIAQLRESEANTRAILDTSLDGIVSIDDAGVIHDFNPAAERMFGYRRDEVIGKPLAEKLIPAVLHGPAGRSRASENASWVGRRLETRARRANGQEFPVELAVVLMRRQGPALLTAYVRDLTTEKRTAQMLAETNARLQAVLDAATQVAIIATDPRGLITLFNSGAERIIGYPATELVGKSTPMVLHVAEEVDAYARQLSEELGTTVRGFAAIAERSRRGGHDEREWTFLRKDGTRLRVNLAVTAIRDGRGRISGYLAIATDVTGRHRAEAALQQAKDAAESANQAKSEFLANMSHEIRTPMNGIIGMTELTLGTDLTAEQREYLDMVRTSATSLLTVINDILDFSKIEAGKLDLDPVDFELRDLVADTLRSLSLRAHAKGLELVFEIPADVPEFVVGDAARLRQVLVNLVGNAIKFTERGEVAVRVSLDADQQTARQGHWEKEPPDNDRGPAASSLSACLPVSLSFEIRDTGIGIPAEKLPHVFEPFVQADSSTTRKYGGTGLGLTITARLVEMMGGHIWVESEPGRGSTFHFTLRLASQQRRPSTYDARWPGSLQGRSVLILDDNASSRTILADMVAGWRMKPTAVGDVAAARHAIEQAVQQSEPFALALIDAHVPGPQGFDLAAELRDRPEAARSVILLLSSSDRQADSSRCRALGLTEHLTKPVKPSDLLERLLKLLASADEASSERPAAEPIAEGVNGSAPEPLTSRGLRILVAEDNPVNQHLSAVILQRMGHQVVVVGNGADAVAVSQREPFDLLLMDVQMPDINGFEATAAIRAREASTGAHLPIVALTAHAMKGDREQCLRAGMDGYVSKPLDVHRLQQVMENVLSRRKVSVLPATPVPFDPTPLRERTGCDDALVRELAGLFRSESTRLVQGLQRALADHNADAVTRTAHTLLGCAANFHAPEVSAAAQHLEGLARSGNLHQAAAALKNLEEVLQKFLASIDIWLEAQPA